MGYYLQRKTKTNNMNYTDFIYSQYTMEELLHIVARNKYQGKYLDSHAERCRLEIIKRQHEQKEIINL